MLLQEGTSGYLNFYPLDRCVEGTISGCNGTIQDGFAIEACAPVATKAGRSMQTVMDGRVVVVNVSASDVGNFRDPFANQVSSDGGKSVHFVWSVLSAAVLGGIGLTFL